MNDKKKYKKKRTKQKGQSGKPAKKQWGVVLSYNVLAFFILLFSLNLFVTKNNGYKWMWNTLLKKNLETIEKYKELTVAQRHESKQGFYAKYLNFINENTPEDAIILIPSDSVINSVDSKYKLKTLVDRRKTTYFIYPRRAVYEKSMEYDSIYLDKITHVAIVNYYGYESLNYGVSNKQQFSVMPVNLNNEKE